MRKPRRSRLAKGASEDLEGRSRAPASKPSRILRQLQRIAGPIRQRRPPPSNCSTLQPDSRREIQTSRERVAPQTPTAPAEAVYPRRFRCISYAVFCLKKKKGYKKTRCYKMSQESERRRHTC